MRKLPKQLIKELKKIEEDCLKLKKRDDLTEFGRGELHVINVIKNHIKENIRK